MLMTMKQSISETDAWPNQEALNKALNIYRAAMRAFIIFHLKRTWGPDVEDVVIGSVGDRRANEIDHRLSKSGDIESVIDVNDFPHLVYRNWAETFERILHDDKTFRNQLWLIAECRNEDWAHPPKGDAESEGTRAHLFLIADVLGKIKRPKKKREVENIRDALFTDDTAERLADTEERLKAVEAKNAEYKRLLSATLEEKVDPAKPSTQDSDSDPERKPPQKTSKTGKIEELLTSLTASVEQKTQAKTSTTEKSQVANTLDPPVEIRHNPAEIHNDVSTIAEKFLSGTTLEERVEIGRKIAALRINPEGAQGKAWWKIREELRRTEGLDLKQEDVREVIRREDHFKESIVQRIESFKDGWECQVSLKRLCGFKPAGKWSDRIEACRP